LRQAWRRDRALPAASAAVLSLLLAGCQGGAPPDARASGQTEEAVLRVADDTRAGGDLGTAASLYRRAHELAEHDPVPLARLGATLAQLHAYTEAAATYRAALEINPNPLEGELRRGLGVVLVSLNQPDAALAELTTAAAKSPDDPRVYNALGVAYDLTGRHEMAQQVYQKGLALAPKSDGLRNNYGLSLALSGDYPAAVATLNELAGDVKASPRHRLNLALVYGLAGDDRKAGAIARATLDEAAVRNNLAYYAMLRGMDDRARANAILGVQTPGPAMPERPARTADATTETPQPAPRVAVDTAPVAAQSTPPATAAEPAPPPAAAPKPAAPPKPKLA
jgi:Flp pilus assembly protein TadD